MYPLYEPGKHVINSPTLRGDTSIKRVSCVIRYVSVWLCMVQRKVLPSILRYSVLVIATCNVRLRNQLSYVTYVV